MKFLLTALAFLFGHALAQPSAPIKDSRDGKIYRTVKIGTQVWMAENLNYEAEGSKCYDNKAEYCKMYGRLYNWEMAMKACPKGWHLPDTTEWQILVDFAGGRGVAGGKLKAKSGWNDLNDISGNGEDKYGFAALPGGFYSNNVGNNGNWWTVSNNCRLLIYRPKYVSLALSRNFDFYSVRCVRN